jgi:hypothetical protein
MEMQLSHLEKTWREMYFQCKPMEEFPDLMILYVPDDLVQTPEENQVAM